METVSLAAIVCDAEGHVLMVNPRAGQLLAGREGLEVSAGRLRASHPRDSDRLLALWGDSLGRARDGRVENGARSILVGATQPGRFVVVTIVTVPQRSSDPGSSGWGPPPAAVAWPLLFVVARALMPSDPAGAEAIERFLGVTTGEARAIAALCQGVSPSAYAQARGLSRHTVRNQLKSAMAKAGVRRQADLVRLAVSCLAT